MRRALKAFTEITEADFCLFVCMTDLSHYHQKVPIKEVNCYKGLTADRASSGPFCLFLLPRNKIFQHYSITFYYSITLTIKVECSQIEKCSCLFMIMTSSCVFDWGCLVDQQFLFGTLRLISIRQRPCTNGLQCISLDNKYRGVEHLLHLPHKIKDKSAH